MKFHLNYKSQKAIYEIHHKHNILLLGSCFADSIGEYLQRYKFGVLKNPYGILFNPISIVQFINDTLNIEEDNEWSIIHRNGVFYSWKCHSSVYATERNELLKKLSNIKREGGSYIAKCDYLFITFGSAFVYRLQENNRIVANCHKQPGNLFGKELLSVNEIVQACKMAFEKWKIVNPKTRIILTVSPVKYLRDGIHGNNLSKATLLLAVNQLCKECECDYFPAYELVSDDLRDYRFYEEDLAHPNEVAVNYVWEKFSETYFEDDTKAINKEIDKLLQAQHHKILFPNTEDAVAFQQNIDKMRKELIKKYPYLRF